MYAILRFGLCAAKSAFRIVQKVYAHYLPNQNIKICPAPNPRKVLKRYGGTLSDEEYFELLHSPILLQSLPPAVTVLIPEVVEVRDEFVRKYYDGKFQGIRSQYKVKRKGADHNTAAELEIVGGAKKLSTTYIPLPPSTKRIKFK